jgi:hypothetical protein
MRRLLHRVGVTRLVWMPYDWSLNLIMERHEDGRPKLLRQIFALKCASCRRFSFGCAKHWFCGICESCRIKEGV